MDELTRERYGDVIPYAEAYATPMPLRRPKVSPVRYMLHRRELCGTDDLIRGAESGMSHDPRHT